MVPAPFTQLGFDTFHLHFVKHAHRPEGTLPLAQFEQAVATAHDGLSRWDEWMDLRIVFYADTSLDALAISFARGNVPFMARANDGGATTSLFVSIPYAAVMIEVVAPTVTVFNAATWSRCHEAVPPVWTRAGREAISSAQSSEAEAYARPDIWPRRFVFPSSNSASAAEFSARYLAGEMVPSAAAPRELEDDGACHAAHRVRVGSQLSTEAELSVELEWVQPMQPIDPTDGRSAPLSVAAFETHLHRVRTANISHASASAWDHYMDFKVGLLFADCAPLLRRLLSHGVPYFVVPHINVFGLHVQVPGGTMIEALCTEVGALTIEELDDWHWCKDPSPADGASLLHGRNLTKARPAARTPTDDEQACPATAPKARLIRPPLCATDDYGTRACALWAARGECTANPSFMSANCARSCGALCLWRAGSLRVASTGRLRQLQRVSPNKTLVEGELRCQQDASTCVAGERCACDLRPLETDTLGVPGLTPFDLADSHTVQIRSVLVQLCERVQGRAAQVLFVGLGTGKMVTTLRNVLPALRVDVIEYDPHVVETAEQFFDYTRTAEDHLIVDDAEVAITQLAGPYDAIVIDCMVAGDTPPSCRSDVFTSHVAALLAPGGVVLQWVWGEQTRELLRQHVQQHPFTHRRHIVFVSPPASGATRDTHADGAACADWAAQGECDANGGFMKQACAASCHSASIAASAAPEAFNETTKSWLVLTDATSSLEALKSALIWPSSLAEWTLSSSGESSVIRKAVKPRSR